MILSRINRSIINFILCVCFVFVDLWAESQKQIENKSEQKQMQMQNRLFFILYIHLHRMRAMKWLKLTSSKLAILKREHENETNKQESNHSRCILVSATAVVLKQISSFVSQFLYVCILNLSLSSIDSYFFDWLLFIKYFLIDITNRNEFFKLFVRVDL